MNKLHVAVVLVALVSACSKGGPKLEPKQLGDTGFVVDAPADWTVTSEMKGFYSVKAAERHGGMVQVMVTDHDGSATLEDVVSSTGCTDATKAKKEKTVAGTFYVQCEGTAATIGDKPVMATKVHAELTVAGHSADCHMNTDHDVDTVAAICKSLRKK